MTGKIVPVDEPEVLNRIIRNTDALLLDFDGPICSVFSNKPASQIAMELREELVETYHATLPIKIKETGDPFELLHFAATIGKEEAARIEFILQQREMEAVSSAKPTLGAHELIRTFHHRKQAVVIVSNNSVSAIVKYLQIHNLTANISHVAARLTPELAILKPSPTLVAEGVSYTNASSSNCTLIGDSITDIQAGKAASVPVIAYANKKKKLQRLIAESPDLVLSALSLHDVSNAVLQL